MNDNKGFFTVPGSSSSFDNHSVPSSNTSINFTSSFPEIGTSAPYMYDNSFYAQKRLASTVVTVILSVLGFVGNLTTIIIFEGAKKRWKREKIFIYVLAWTDLIALGHILVGKLIENFNSLNYPDGYLCKYIVYSLVTIAEVSTYLLAVIAFQRFKLICRPAKSRMSLKQKRAAVLLSVLLGAIFCFPVVFFSGNDETDILIGKGIGTVKGHPCRFYQTMGFDGIVWIIASLHYIAIIFGSVCYLRLGKVLFEKTRNSIKRSESRATKIEADVGETEGCQTEVGDEQSDFDNDIEEKNTNSISMSPLKNPEALSVRSRIRKAKKRNIRKNFTFMFISIFVVNIIATIPIIAVGIHAYKDMSIYFRKDTNDVLLFFLALFQRGGIFIHVVNPFIYAYFDLEIRREAIRLFCGFLNAV